MKALFRIVYGRSWNGANKKQLTWILERDTKWNHTNKRKFLPLISFFKSSECFVHAMKWYDTRSYQISIFREKQILCSVLFLLESSRNCIWNQSTCKLFEYIRLYFHYNDIRLLEDIEFRRVIETYSLTILAFFGINRWMKLWTFEFCHLKQCRLHFNIQILDIYKRLDWFHTSYFVRRVWNLHRRWIDRPNSKPKCIVQRYSWKYTAKQS